MEFVVVNELLCFLVTKYSKFTKVHLKSILLGFYSETELSDAKDLLFADALKLSIDHNEMPRFIKRARGDNRARLIADDVIELITFLDERKAVDGLPMYVARNLDRVPMVKMEDMELFCLVNKLGDLDRRLAAIEAAGTGAASLAVTVSKMEELCQRAERDTGAVPVARPVHQAPLADLPNTIIATTASQCFQAVKDSAVIQDPDTESWTIVRRPVRVRGAKTAVEDALTPVTAIPRKPPIPRKPILRAFVSRLHIDTTEEGLANYLTSEGMKGVVCRRIKQKAGQKFSTAAFFVSCCTESEDLFYSDTCWPDGTELRDWVSKRNG